MLNLRQVVLPLVFAILLGLVLFALTSVVLRSTVKGSLVAALGLVLFWNYSLFFQVLRYLHPFRERYILMFIIMVFTALALLVILTNKKGRLEAISTVVLVVVLFLVLLNLVTIVPGEIKKSAANTENEESQSGEVAIPEAVQRPDLYLLIFDEYARLDTIKREWGYDNSAFGAYLAREGFFLAEESRVSAPSTAKTMPELLNMEYLDKGKSEAELISLYYNNRLFSYFDELGYDIYCLDGYDHPLKSTYPSYVQMITYRDVQRSEQSILTDSFVALLYARSILKPFERFLGLGEPGLYYFEGNLGFFDYIKNIFPVAESPKFVFAHLWFPHLPYVFDREGNMTNNSVHYFEYQDYEAEALKAMYLEQYIYATTVIKEMIESIKSKNENEAIIIIQSDHGPRQSSAGNSNPEDGYKVINAIYFPGGDYSLLTDDITPVNTMRVVMNQFFGKELEMLE